MIKAFLFDLDGVITDSSKAHFKAWQLTSLKYGIDLPHAFEESLKGISRKESLDAILDYANIVLDDSTKHRFMNQKNNTYLELIQNYDQSYLLEGVLELFELAKQSNIKCALVSASKNAGTLLQALKMKSFFDYIVNPSNHPSKPAPDMFEDALKAFEINASEAIGFEDSSAGIKAIIKAGIYPIGIGHFENIPSFESIKDAIPYIKTFIKRSYDTTV